MVASSASRGPLIGMLELQQVKKVKIIAGIESGEKQSNNIVAKTMIKHLEG